MSEPDDNVDFTELASAKVMAQYFIHKSTQFPFIKDPFKALGKAKKALQDYALFKKKRLAVHPGIKLILESNDACYKIYQIILKLETGKIPIHEMNLLQIKNLVVEAYKNKEFPFLLRGVLEKLTTGFFMQNNINFNITRIFLMLTIDTFKKLQNNGFTTKCIEEPPDLSSCKSMELGTLFLQLEYLQSLACFSRFRITRDKEYSEDQEEQDKIFEGLLEQLHVEDFFTGLPRMVETFKQATILGKLMLPRIDQFEQMTDEFFPEWRKDLDDTDHLSVKYWRGVVYHTMCFFQKDAVMRAELCKKSMKIWTPLMQESFSKKQVYYYLATKPGGNALKIYMNLMLANTENYEHLINIKCFDLINSTPKDVKSSIHEVNELRRVFCELLEQFVQFCEINPGYCVIENLYEGYSKLTAHYGRMIMDDDKEHQLMYNKALAYCIKNAQRKDLPPCFSSPTDIARMVLLKISTDEFVQKFRKQHQRSDVN